ncbi:hypothetical protein [Bacillus litorisediminis]|uniref:hypothetical protein n=1 Tax=Bacillus litorisediminis TaxID=2922713 RepID=UPI001FADAA25|nr:hypothetical protein [Bacillus litorisediminis]
MILPKNFDQNEWFILISLIAVISIICFLPKRFPHSITILIFAYAVTVGRVTDRFLAAPWADFYDIMDTGKFDLFDLFSYVLYAMFSYLFIYIFHRMKMKGLLILVYIVLWSLFSVGFEWISAQFEVVKYKGWVPYLSFNYYLAIEALTLLFFTYLKKVYRKTVLKQYEW